MQNEITREIDAHRALRQEAEKAKEPSRIKAGQDNQFTIDNR